MISETDLKDKTIKYLQQLFGKKNTFNILERKTKNVIVNGHYSFQKDYYLFDGFRCSLCPVQKVNLHTVGYVLINTETNVYVKYTMMDEHFICEHGQFPNEELYMSFCQMLNSDDIETYQPAKMLTLKKWIDDDCENTVCNTLLFQNFIGQISISKKIFNTGHVCHILPRKIDIVYIFELFCKKVCEELRLNENTDLPKIYSEFYHRHIIDKFIADLSWEKMNDLYNSGLNKMINSLTERYKEFTKSIYSDMIGTYVSERIMSPIYFASDMRKFEQISSGNFDGLVMLVTHPNTYFMSSDYIKCESGDIEILSRTGQPTWHIYKEVNYMEL